MDEITSYAFNVDVWYDDGCWYYSVVQEFNENEDDEDIQPLAYGTTETDEEAFSLVAKEIQDYFGR